MAQRNDHPRWGALADAVKAARVSSGKLRRARFARELEIDDSTLAIIEGAKAGRVSEQMLDYVTGRLGWQPRDWQSYLEGTVPDGSSVDPIRAASDTLLLAELLRRANERELRQVI